VDTDDPQILQDSEAVDMPEWGAIDYSSIRSKFTQYLRTNINPSMLASVHHTVMNVFKGTINVKTLRPGE
jgi:hypothetical protein